MGGKGEGRAALAELFEGRYEVGEKLPWGGLAPIYEGREAGRPVAIAVLPLDCERSMAAQQAFSMYAAALETFEHPGFVPITDSGVQGGVPYIELERVEAVPLTVALARGPIRAKKAVAIARQIVEAIAAAHELDLVHWDLTPSNVLLERGSGGGGRVRLLGLGVAPLLHVTRDSDATGPTGRGSGPNAKDYIAPEVRASRGGGMKADQFSVGALLHRMVIGARPFAGGAGSFATVAGLSAVVKKATAEDPAERYEDIRALGAALRELSGGAPLPGGPAPSPTSAAASDAFSIPPAGAAGEASVSPPSATPRPATAAPPAGVPWGPIVAVVALLMVVAGVGGWMLGAGGPAESASPPVAVSAPVAVAPTAPVPSEAAAAPEVSSAGAVAISESDAVDAGAPSEPDAAVTPVASDAAGDAGVTAPVVGDVAGSVPPLLGPLSPVLQGVLARVRAGERLTQEELRPVYGEITRDPHNPQGHLVLARAFMANGWLGGAADAYARASRVRGELSGDGETLRDLLHIVAEREDLYDTAFTAIRRVWGAAALPQVRAAVESASGRPEARRLRRLERRLSRLPP